LSKIRIHPHLTASADAVTWGPWALESTTTRMPLGPLIDGWDYDQPLRIGTSPIIDEDELRASTGLDTLRDVYVVATADCPGTSSRFVAGMPVSEYLGLSDRFIAVSLEPGTIALELRLACHIVLLGNHEQRASEAAASGSRLAESPSTRLLLEGEASRFPTEAISFESVGLEPAAWSVKVEPDEMNEAFAGCVRLMLNLDNEVGAALAGMDPVAYAAHGSTLRMDILRSTIHVAIEVSLDEQTRIASYDEDSFGGVVERMCSEHFRMSLSRVAELRRHDVDRFERLLQASVGFGVPK